jgi:hypothetical protein
MPEMEIKQHFVYCVYLRDEPPLCAFEKKSDADAAAEALHAIDIATLNNHSGVNYWGVSEVEIFETVLNARALRRLRGL